MSNNEFHLSDEEKALRIFEGLKKFIEEHPEEIYAPEMVITQDWKVSFDYGGWRSDSDYVCNVTSIMRRDEDGQDVFDLEYITSKVPEIQKSLDESAEYCEEQYGTLPSHDDMEFAYVTNYVIMISGLIESAIENNQLKGWILEIDTPIGDTYLVKEEMRSPSYGGLILHYDPMKFVNVSDKGEMSVDLAKVQELADRILKDDLTGEFANDDDDEGGDLFRSEMDKLNGPDN